MLLAVMLATSITTAQAVTVDCGKNFSPRELTASEAVVKKVRFEDWPRLVCSKYSGSYDNVSFKPIGSYNATRTVARSDEITGQMEIGEISGGRVKITWSANDGINRISLWLNISAERKAWVFKRDLRPEQEIKRHHVYRRSVNVATIQGLQHLVTENPVGKSTKKMVRKGQPVTENLISDPPMILKNGEIKIIASNGRLTISTIGMALETAWSIGDKIQVRIDGATDSVSGTVSGVNTAYVQI